MDVPLAVSSKRDVRRYTGRPLDDALTERILDAGRLAGSARNRQPSRFVIAEGPALPWWRAPSTRPGNVLDAGLVVALVVSPGGDLVDFDAGRAAQNMMLAAWAEGVASCPNGVADPEAMHAALGVDEPERVVVVISFGAPVPGRDPARRTPEEWSRRAHRLPLDSLVQRVSEPRG